MVDIVWEIWLHTLVATVLHFRPVGKIGPRKPSLRLNSKISFTTTKMYILTIQI